jgi:hypothetical protein
VAVRGWGVEVGAWSVEVGAGGIVGVEVGVSVGMLVGVAVGETAATEGGLGVAAGVTVARWQAATRLPASPRTKPTNVRRETGTGLLGSS